MRLRGAISGFGEVAAQAHLPAWRARPELAIVAIHDPLPERRHEALRLIPGVRVYDELELMLSGERPDFVDVASPPALHGPSARAALTAGAHVLVEKPLCFDPAELRELLGLAAARARALMCVHNWKYAPPYKLAHDLAASGRLGALRYLALDRIRPAPAGRPATGGGAGWRRLSAAGGGILVDHGWHVFYLMQWLLGGERPVAVAAHLDTPAPSGVEEVAELRVLFPEDKVARAFLSWHAPVRRTLATLYGEQAMLEIDGNRVTVTECGREPADLTVADSSDDSYHAAWFAAVADEFVRACASEGNSPEALANLSEAETALELMLGARASARAQGREIEISPAGSRRNAG